MIYRIEVSERRPEPTKEYPRELLSMEIELESFDFKRLFALLMDMIPAKQAKFVVEGISTTASAPSP